MRPTADQHPTDADLAAFALGKLNRSAIDWVGQHLSDCPTCRSVVEETPRDSLLNILKRSDPVPAAGKTGPCIAVTDTHSNPSPAASSIDPNDVPPALRDHARYRVIRMLGRGGMGVVYQAEHKVMERVVAVKIVSRALVDRPDALERFHREVRAAAKLDHPNIVKAHDAETAGDLQLLAMEYVEGKSLADVLHKKGPLPIANACHYVRQAALGLQHAFEHGMVHRDLKPQNLMLTPKGVVKILDFGLAKLASESARPGGGLTQDNMVMGTPEYMAPEQAISSKTADVRADIYALGCTLYCLLTGRPPFAGETPLAVIVLHSQDAAPPVESLRPDTPPALAALVARCLAKDPADRPQTPKELAGALHPFSRAASKSAPSPATVAPSPTIRPPSQPKNRRWFISSAVAAGLLLAVGVVATVVMWVKVPGGIVKLEVEPADAKVEVVDGKITVSHAGDAEPWRIELAGDKGQLKISKAGFVLQTRDVTLSEKGQTIRVELKPEPPAPLPTADGFVPLFNGKDLTGWVADGGGEDAWRVEDGELVMRGVALDPDRAGAQSYLLTEKNYADFVLRFQFRRTADTAITGIALRAVPGETARSSRPDTTNDYPYHLTVWIGKYKELEATGGLWWSPHSGQVRPLAVDRLAEIRPAGEWNDVEVEMLGQSLRVAVNGREVQNVMLNKTRPEGFPALGLSRYAGRVGLLKRNGEVRFRKIEIKELSADVTDARAPGVVGIWDHSVPAKNINMRIDLLPDGRIKGAKNDKPATWILEGSTLTMTWGEKGTLGKEIWRDVCTVAPDGKSYTGRDLNNGLVVGKRVVPPGAATDGFVPLFNGKDLTGWRVDGGTSHEWTVEDGAIVGRSTTPNTRCYVLSDKSYTDYVLRFEFNVESGHHGVAIRAVPGENVPFNGRQLFDHPIIKLVHPGILNQKQTTGTTNWVKSAATNVPPVKNLAFFADAWQPMEVVVRKDICTASIAGEQIVNTTLDPNDRATGGIVPGLQRASGKVGFQTNTGAIRFRKIEIKELSATDGQPAVPVPAPAADGFVSLFNGKDLTGWEPLPGGAAQWGVEDGAIVGRAGRGYLFSKRGDYSDFDIRAKVKIGPGANSGLLFRMPYTDELKTGYEAQVEDSADRYPTGSLHGLASAPRGLVAADEWFTLEVIAAGPRIRILVDGKETVDYTDPAPRSLRGFLALQQWVPGREVRFGKIEIKELPSAALANPGPGPAPAPNADQPAAAMVAPEKSEWAGMVTDEKGQRANGGAWRFTERRGTAFKALWRSGTGGKAVFEGVIDDHGRISLQAREFLAPKPTPREAIEGTGEVGIRSMSLVLKNPKDGSLTRIHLKRFPDGGEGFHFPGRWKCFHQPNNWQGFRTVTKDKVFTDGFKGDGPWERDGALIITHYPGGGSEWLIIDPDKPKELRGSNGSQAVTWVRQ